jgi:dynein heavy chain, axonemal
MPEDLVLIRALRDMNMPKLEDEDVQLFSGIMSDLFPGSEFPDANSGALQTAIEVCLIHYLLIHVVDSVKFRRKCLI